MTETSGTDNVITIIWSNALTRTVEMPCHFSPYDITTSKKCKSSLNKSGR